MYNNKYKYLTFFIGLFIMRNIIINWIGAERITVDLIIYVCLNCRVIIHMLKICWFAFLSASINKGLGTNVSFSSYLFSYLICDEIRFEHLLITVACITMFFEFRLFFFEHIIMDLINKIDFNNFCRFNSRLDMWLCYYDLNMYPGNFPTPPGPSNYLTNAANVVRGGGPRPNGGDSVVMIMITKIGASEWEIRDINNGFSQFIFPWISTDSSYYMFAKSVAEAHNMPYLLERFRAELPACQENASLLSAELQYINSRITNGTMDNF